jgi:excisionase family DNA binding protein
MNTDTQTPTLPALLTIKQAAAFLGVSRSTVYTLIGKEALPVVRPLPDAPRFRRADLEAYVQSLGNA